MSSSASVGRRVGADVLRVFIGLPSLWGVTLNYDIYRTMIMHVKLFVEPLAAPLFNYLVPSESADERMVTLTFASWNLISGWLARLDAVRHAS
jgi:hypothetical protein